MSRPFQFKEFTIYQDHAAMKVGTDGVLLGAWAHHDNPKRILDIGSGTGLLTLMMAQRFPRAKILGVELASEAMIDAIKNIEHSIWKDRISLIQNDILKEKFEIKFDLVISNPPFFPLDTPSPNDKRAIARSGHFYSLNEWLTIAYNNLELKGRIAFILPIEQWSLIQGLALEIGLHICRWVEIRPIVKKPAHRVLVELQREKCNSIEKKSLIIETDKRHHYSEDYIKLTRSFYLKMD